MNKTEAYAHLDKVRGDAPHGYLLSGTGSGTWGSRVNYRTWTDSIQPISQFAAHFNGDVPTANNGSVVRGAESFHIDTRKFRGIAYNWLVDGAGIVYEARGYNKSGAQLSDPEKHNGVDFNAITTACQFTVGGSQEPTSAQWEAFEWVREVLWAPVFGNQRLVGHKEVDPVHNPKTCPGPVIFPYVETHRFLEGDDDMAIDPENHDFLNAFAARQRQLDDEGTSLGWTLELLRAIAAKSGISATDSAALAAAVLKDTTGGGGLTAAEVRKIIADSIANG